MRSPLLLLLAPLLVVAVVACSAAAGRANEPEWLPQTPDARADYQIFAVRCSKCHSLARPLSTGIDDDEFWRLYVAKMRRQPGSGISAEDATATLRFLHLYVLEQRRRKGVPVEPTSSSPPPADDAGAAPPSRTP
jgi:hypothetical protein